MREKPTILVTGGSGHLGTEIMRALGKTARAVSYDLTPPRIDAPFIAGSVLALAEIEAAMRGIDVVIHVAAIPNPRDRPPDTTSCSTRMSGAPGTSFTRRRVRG